MLKNTRHDFFGVRWPRADLDDGEHDPRSLGGHLLSCGQVIKVDEGGNHEKHWM